MVLPQNQPFATHPGAAAELAPTMLDPLHQIQELTRSHSDALRDDQLLNQDELAYHADSLAQYADYLAQLSSARAEFLSKVSHELRTPLTIAKGWMNMLRYSELTESQQRIVQVVEQQVDDLTRLVNDLLDLSRHETSTLKLNLESIDLVALVEQVAEHQRELTALLGITLAVRATSTQLNAFVDRGRIAQVLNNLISNACRYVPHYANGRIELYVAEVGTGVRLSVSDNGVGIASEHLPRIFEPFYQIDAKRRGKSGLGLAIAQELVRAHAGSLTVDSRVGVGTTFTIWLGRLEPLDETRQASPEERR